MQGLVVTLVAQVAMAQVSVINDVVVVRDPSGAINGLLGFNNMSLIPSHQEQFCRAAFNAARAGGLRDDFDGVISFSTSEQITDLENVFQGPPVRPAALNIGRDPTPPLWPQTSAYNSNKIGHCAFMGTLGRTASFIGGQGTEALPASPDSPWAPSIGIPIPGITSLSGVEIMGHEYGHHWLNGVEFDQNDGRGRQHFIRGFGGQNGENGEMGHPNQHYSGLADSRSVMYGECITDLGNGSFRLQGCDRKYSHIDQYLMGLRGACEADPMMVLENPANPGQGEDVIAMGKTSSGRTVNGYTRHDITVEEIQRAMGRRDPAYPHAQRCWRVAFIVVLTGNETAVPPAMMTKLQAYRQRWGAWFQTATDGRGTMLTNVFGNGCPVQTPIADPCDLDAGVRWPDGGVYVPDDAGVELDAGIEVDAGVEDDAGIIEPDAGVDAGQEPIDSGVPIMMEVDGGEPICLSCETTKIKPGCGCANVELDAVALFAVVLLLVRRRAR